MLSNAYFLAKFRFDTAENERSFAEILPIPHHFGKPASLFSSVPTQGGGAETALQTAVALLAHLGMVLWEGG